MILTSPLAMLSCHQGTNKETAAKIRAAMPPAIPSKLILRSIHIHLFNLRCNLHCCRGRLSHLYRNAAYINSQIYQVDVYTCGCGVLSLEGAFSARRPSKDEVYGNRLRGTHVDRADEYNGPQRGIVVS